MALNLPVNLFADHPRRCGENAASACRQPLQRGSPPQVRGKPVRYLHTLLVFPDHPRRCGENCITVLHCSRHGGSPPQVRGKHSVLGVIARLGRITPAGAGKTATLRSLASVRSDHPRRCGENASICSVIPCLTGSPPQVRGKLMPACINCGIARITPAGAGKTWRNLCYHGHEADHPRRCGENPTVLCWFCKNCGSPPQVRGKLRRAENEIELKRITPAGAGKTGLHRARSCARADHPRRCGENWVNAHLIKSITGSPPQVRGKHGSHADARPITRITPAGAGKTPCAFAVPSTYTDHPRRCGENLWAVPKHVPVCGSPPQVRGKPRQHTAKCSNIRITPAGAGKTF